MTDVIVNTLSGKIRGYERNGALEFLGIPYAEAPIGELRLKRAVPIKSWEGILDAGQYGAPSVQSGREGNIGSEDCLTMNICRPLEGENLPVLVFIHGGGYNTGMASDPLISGESFVKNGIVYVTFQYRLNVWGFYDFSTYAPGEAFDTNCGMSDHIVAMRWIHENIRFFGGDPERVTISGESAGAMSVVAMMTMPALRGTFQQAISSSSLPNGIHSHKTARENMDLFLEGMGWTEDDLPKMKTVDAFEVLTGNDHVAKMHQVKNPGICLPANVVDDLIPKRPVDAIAEGAAREIKLMIGTNLHEGSMFVRPGDTNFPNSWEMVDTMLEKNGYAHRIQEFHDYYGSRNHRILHGVEEAFIHLTTDMHFRMPAIKIAQSQSKHNDVYLYRFEYISEFARKHEMMADHAMDLPFDFNKTDFGFGKIILGEDDPQDVQRLAEEIHGNWINFVKYGCPNPEWDKYTCETRKVRIYDRQCRTETEDNSELLALWNDMHFYE